MKLEIENCNNLNDLHTISNVVSSIPPTTDIVRAHEQLQYSFTNTPYHVGRGGSHIWIKRATELNHRLAIIYF